MKDELRTLLFTETPARAQLVRLEEVWKRIHEHHPYPPAVRRMLGELVAASALLSASLKFNGSLILQIHGDGPVNLVVAECHNDLGIRATVKLRDEQDCPDDLGFTELVNAHGKGRFAIILDPKDRQPGQQPYQGIVPLSGGNVAQAIAGYMTQSEQLQTALWLEASDESACGLMLQQMPSEGGLNTQGNEDAWEHLTVLGNTLRPNELQEKTTETLARHLFWEAPHETLAVRTPTFRCTCSREKVGRMLVSLGRQEVSEALADMPKLTIHCDYCNTVYFFDGAECDRLFEQPAGETPKSDEGGTLH